MIAALAALRRLGTGFMLVAMLAVVVGTGLTSASGFQPLIETLEDAGPEHSHMHGDGTVHSHVVVTHQSQDGEVSGDPLGDPEQHEHQKPSCCSLAQPVALLGGADAVMILDSGSATLALPPLFHPFGIDPNGLRRPPRTLSAA
ncbi:DNA polymerase III subunit gamma/tau [Methylobacterium sp. CM6244]